MGRRGKFKNSRERRRELRNLHNQERNLIIQSWRSWREEKGGERKRKLIQLIESLSWAFFAFFPFGKESVVGCSTNNPTHFSCFLLPAFRANKRSYIDASLDLRMGGFWSDFFSACSYTGSEFDNVASISSSITRQCNKDWGKMKCFGFLNRNSATATILNHVSMFWRFSCQSQEKSWWASASRSQLRSKASFSSSFAAVGVVCSLAVLSLTQPHCSLALQEVGQARIYSHTTTILFLPPSEKARS